LKTKVVVRWGILGAAWIAKERVIPALQAAKNTEVVAIASRNKKKSNALAEHFHIPRAYESYEELLNDPEIDAVYIPLPNHLHAEWTIRAAEAGKHVLCEKPAGLNVKEVEEMVTACRNNQVVFMEAFAFRSHPDWQRLKEMIDSRYIGEIRNVQARYSISVESKDDIRLNPTLGGGVLYDLGSYCVNGVRFVMGDEPEEVQGMAQLDTNQVDVSIVAAMKFPGNRLAQIDCSFESVYNQSFEISGTEGIIKIKFPFRYPQWTVLKNGREETEVFRDAINTYVAEVEHFSSCILLGETPRYRPEESIANMKVVESIYASIRKTT
jgi:predicted dehydrogenase